MVRLARIYDPPGEADGYRVLVDRLWPRGLARTAAAIDEWEKTVAPSHDLRRWYGHVPDRWPEFEVRYRRELADPERAQALAHLQALARRGDLVLLTATRDPDRSHAGVLQRMLQETT